MVIVREPDPYGEKTDDPYLPVGLEVFMGLVVLYDYISKPIKLAAGLFNRNQRESQNKPLEKQIS